MENETNNIVGWSTEIRKNQMLYPDERVVAFLTRNFPKIEDNINKRALDIGFGSGRHIKLLLDYGFSTFGVDYSNDAVDVAKRIFQLRHEKRVFLQTGDLRDNLFENAFFDVIICYGTIFYREVMEVKKDLQIIYRLLNSNGKMIINFRTKENDFYKKGKKIDDNSFILDSTTKDYEGILYTFFDLDEAEKILIDVGFKIDNRERVDFWKNNLEQHHSWWIFTVKK